MERECIQKNVYEAIQKCFGLLFREFENIYVSFSGDRDSGLLLNLLLDFKCTYYPQRTVDIFRQDFGAQYTVTTEYVTKTFKRLESEVGPYWVCLPMATRAALSSYEMFWYLQNDGHPELWIRPTPGYSYVINMDKPSNHYRYRMHQEDLARQLGRFYRERHGGGHTVCLLGLRVDESLQRYSRFVNKKHGYKGGCWISKQFKGAWCASPLYDWFNRDVWIAISRFGYEYNRLYGLYYQTGLKIDQMRVASPFNDYSRDALNLCRVIDPEIWIRLVGRVQGANFGAIHGWAGAMGYHSIILPEGHTWQSYTKFLLDALLRRLRNSYVKKFRTSIQFWREMGDGLSEGVIRELEEHGYQIQRDSMSNYTLDKRSRVVSLGPIPDHTNGTKSTKDIPNWKRMCYCILKNDRTCRFMGFSLTRQEQKRVDLFKRKCRGIINDR